MRKLSFMSVSTRKRETTSDVFRIGTASGGLPLKSSDGSTMAYNFSATKCWKSWRKRLGAPTLRAMTHQATKFWWTKSIWTCSSTKTLFWLETTKSSSKSQTKSLVLCWDNTLHVSSLRCHSKRPGVGKKRNRIKRIRSQFNDTLLKKLQKN